MTYEWPEIASLLLLWTAACVPAWLVYRRRRDVFDPRVFYPCFYAYMTSGPCLFKIFSAGAYHPGLKVDLLVPVLASCSSAVAGFSVGGWLALRQWPYKRPGQSFLRSTFAPRERSANALLREIAIVGAAATIAAYGYFSYQLQSQVADVTSGGKAHVIAAADEELLGPLYFFAAAATASLTLAVVADACVSRSAFSLPILALLAAQFAACTYNGERDVLLAGGVWCVSNWHKLTRTQIVLASFALVGWLGVSPMLRVAGLGFGDQLAAVGDFTAEEWFYSVTHFAPNIHVYTNVATEVPDIDAHWYGSSVVGAFASFVPGDFALKDVTPTRWFSDVYDMQRVAGYAFSQDAEAYLNFGWIGPPLWFGVWGYVLGVFYRRASRPGARLLDVFNWWFAVATWLFGVRSDTRAILKMLIVGVAATLVLSWIARAMASRYGRKGATGVSPVRGAERVPNSALAPRPWHTHRRAAP